MRVRRSILVGLAAALAGCLPGSRGRPEVTIAAAANLMGVFDRVGPAFEAQTGIHPIFSFASTAQLATQIGNSAPFDVFTAADSEHVAALDLQGLLTPGSRAVYAVGVLAVWIPPTSQAKVNRLEDLTLPAVRLIAVAKPELAPYGRASVSALQHLGIWDLVKAKVVYAENISMAKQFGASGNADAVFTAYSLVLGESGKIIRVDPGLHLPIEQTLGIVARSPHQKAAREFVAYLITGEGKDILRSYGYEDPAGR
jgi:molybdate transport system substrate-binding protein